jgi:2,3-bisphosphoglycerate-independent phosphoglycerate mutase
MSAHEIVQLITPELESGSGNAPDFVCLNFANPDMVGHTGVFDAIVKAVEVTDQCLQSVVESGLANGYQFIVIADHGNADFARHADGSPHTAHTTNPVPVVVLSEQVEAIEDGILADVAPTVLKLMGIDQPSEMTGTPLF